MSLAAGTRAGGSGLSRGEWTKMYLVTQLVGHSSFADFSDTEINLFLQLSFKKHDTVSPYLLAYHHTYLCKYLHSYLQLVQLRSPNPIEYM